MHLGTTNKANFTTSISTVPNPDQKTLLIRHFIIQINIKYRETVEIETDSAKSDEDRDGQHHLTRIGHQTEVHRASAISATVFGWIEATFRLK